MKHLMQARKLFLLKRAIAVLLVLVTAVSCFTACDNSNINSEEPITTDEITEARDDDEDDGDNEGEPITEPIFYPLNSSTPGIKILGERYLASTAVINCDWTGSGIEMDVDHHGGDIVFTASATADCLFRVYVDGEAWEKGTYSDPAYYKVTKNLTYIKLQDVPVGEHRIKVIKVTGYTIARAQIHYVEFCGTICEEAPEQNTMYIEFVGDSISCGWGNIGNHQGAYTDQDGTLAYPLMISDRLNADYAVTALSGQGLIYGPSCTVTEGYLYGSPLRSKDKKFAFERKADIVVINIGTNDYSQRNNANITKASFKAAYLAFLRTVAEKNGPNCQIYCLYNTMNDTFKDAIIEAVAEFGGAAKNAYTYEMTRANGNQHPNLAEHEQYTEDLLKKMGFN